VPSLFYAAVNLGFISAAYTPVNKNIWREALLRHSSNLKPLEQPEPLVASNSGYGQYIINPLPPDSGNTFPIDSLSNDTAGIFQDTLLTADTIKIDPRALDSTARLEYFKYKREDVPYTRLERKKVPGFFAEPSSNLKTKEVRIDSTGRYVEIIEKIANQRTKIILRMPIEDYIDLRIALKERELWEDLGYTYELKDEEKGLGELIKDITDFEIPLPSVGVLSIFGEPKISLKIGGAVDIHGAWRNETTEGVTASRLGNTRNEPDFKQQVQINVSGTIGDKLNINADWNTERQFEYENQLKIKYTGYEDEIIQSIEAGNVSLQTSSLVGGSEALFGVKANFKMGPLSLTTLASQKKGEIKEVSVSGGSTSQEFQIRAYDYSQNHYFIDTIYANNTIFSGYYGSATPVINSAITVVYIEVWKSVEGIVRDRSKERQAITYINLPQLNSETDKYLDTARADRDEVVGQIETGRFLLLTEGEDYTLHPETGYITFKTAIQDKDVIAVAYRIENGPGPDNDAFFGEFLSTSNIADTTAKLVLKLVKPSGLQSPVTNPQYAQAWRLQLKNIYPIGGRNIKEEGFEFNIKYEIPGQDPVTELGGKKLITAFGLDVTDATGTGGPDNVFDYRPNLTIIPATGEIIFPNLEPFGSDIPKDLPDFDSIAYVKVYTESKTFAQQEKQKDKWQLTGKYSGDATSVYQLGFNIVENSVRVLLNGRDLSPGSDYVVDYNIGQLTIRNDAALVPGADLRITYEQNDLFQLASKTLLGARGLLEFSSKTKLGFSVLNLNQQTLSDKVRIGEEPLSNTIYGVDFSTSADLPFLTKALDNIISTRQMSSFSIGGEFAYINPDPNTKKSNIISDMGKSIAYIDDFEGAKRIIPVGVTYTAWRDLSPPDFLISDTLTAAERMSFKGKSFWFTQTPSNVNVKQIWPERQTARADEQVTVMDYVFMPDTPGTFNYNPSLAEREKNWGGIMKILSSTASNLVEENIEFIELWIKNESADPNTKIYIDLGRISEDVLPNRLKNTEDRFPENDAIDDESEDVGLDGWTDAQERDPAVNTFLTVPSTANDPSGDNFSFSGGSELTLSDYFGINGTQGNAILTDIGRLPDTEDLNRNGNIDLVNSYFRYEILLDTNRLTNPYIAGGGNNAGWYLYRIPLKESSLEVGSPNLSNVEYIRLFTTDVANMVHLRFAEFNLVGSQWQRLNLEDTTLSVSVINIEDNSPGYTSPPGIVRERDRSRPDEDILRNEQSLNLIVNNLQPGESRAAVKYLFRPLDVFNYREMKMFIHGDTYTGPGSVSAEEGSPARAEVFYRFGADTNHYYEYRQPVRPGWNEISIDFNQLTSIKQARDSVASIINIPVEGKSGHFYSVKGNPSLTSIKLLIVGIRNIDDPNRPVGRGVSGEVWINELRVIGADDSDGWAYSFNSRLQFADLMSVTFNMSQTNPYFHKLSDRFGSRVESKNWSAAADLDVIKILPVNLPESNLKITYSHTESIGKPLYLPGTDVKVDEAAERLRQADTLNSRNTKTADQLVSESQTVNISDTWSASNIKLKIPSSFWLVRDTWNALTFGFNYNKAFSRSPTVQNNNSWVWNANMSYGLSFSPDYHIFPANIPVIGSVISLFADYRNVKIYFLPQTFTFNASARRNRNINVTRPTLTSTAQEIVSRDFVTQRGFNIGWKVTEGGLLNLTVNYNVNINSSLAYLETDSIGGFQVQRAENDIWRDILSEAFFGRDFQYQQSLDFRTAPKLPALWNINKFFTITASYGASYQWNNDFRQAELGRSAGYSNKATVGLTLKWKLLTEPLFTETPGTQEQKVTQTQTTQRGRDRIIQENAFEDSSGISRDSLITSDSTDIESVQKPSAIKNALLFFRSAAKFIFFDYDQIVFNFSSDNNLSKSGLKSEGSGFNNFWGVSFNPKHGPSRSFMVGLGSDVGPRANGNLSDVFSQKNSFDFKTSRPLWEGAKIDLNWKVGWSINKNTTIISDNGRLIIQNIKSTGTIDRSFLSLPPFLFLSVLKSGIKQVNELYDPQSADPNQSLSEAFVQGFESAPLFSKLGFLQDVAKYIPRPNWRVTWDGLESFFLFKSFAKRVSLNHEYRSLYTEGWEINPSGIKQVRTQRIEYGFAPLVGLNFTFSELWGGNLISSVKYSTRSNYDLGISTRNITETFSRDIGITAGYSKSGFEIPLFGVSLKNDIEFSFSYTSTKNSVVIFDMNNFSEEGTPQDGTTRITMEPRIKYTISSKVTLSIFYRRSSVEPEGAARIPPTTTNEAGLDVHISIQ
jgi:cell surface protein SprA